MTVVQFCTKEWEGDGHLRAAVIYHNLIQSNVQQLLRPARILHLQSNLDLMWHSNGKCVKDEIKLFCFLPSEIFRNWMHALNVFFQFSKIEMFQQISFCQVNQLKWFWRISGWKRHVISWWNITLQRLENFKTWEWRGIKFNSQESLTFDDPIH